MRICVYGAGAIGGGIAARLGAAGEDVSVIARGAQAEAIRTRGLTLMSGESRIEARVRCVSDPAELGAQDLVIVTLKGHQLPAIAIPLGRMLESGAPVVFAMNGILWWFADGLPVTPDQAFNDLLDPGGELRRQIPAQQIVGAVVNSPSEVIEPGVILNSLPQRNRLLLGSPLGSPPDSSSRASSGASSGASSSASSGASQVTIDDISRVFSRAGYTSPVEADIRRAIWKKLVIYLGGSPAAALTHCTLDQLASDDEAFALMLEVMREAIAIGARMGFAYDNDPGAELAVFRGRPSRPSMLQDFELGRRPELEGSVLAAQAFAKALDVPAPRIAMLATLLRMKAAGGAIARPSPPERSPGARRASQA